MEPVKKLEMVYVIWLSVGSAINFITLAKSTIYCMGVKSMASGLTFLHTQKTILFTTCQYNLLFATVIKCIALSISN